MNTKTLDRAGAVFLATSALLLSGCQGGPYQRTYATTTAPSGQRIALPVLDAVLVSPRDPSPMRISGRIDGIPSYGMPFRLPGHATWMTPFVVAQQSSIFRDADPFTKGGLASKSDKDQAFLFQDQLATIPIRWHNALFSTQEDGENWALLDRRGFLSRYWMLVTLDEPESDSPELVAAAHLFAATLADTNGDGFLNDKDAAVIVLTDGAGRGGRTVTPPGCQVAAVRYSPEERRLLFDLRFDGDDSGTFEPLDPIEIYQMPLDDPDAVAMPWHSEGLRSHLDDLYD